MPMKKAGTKTTRPAEGPPSVAVDGRVAELLEDLKSDPALAVVVGAFEQAAAQGTRGRKFGSNGLKVNGKLFALFTQGTLVVKLPKDRVAELVASRVGKPFDPGHGRLMKEWLTVVAPKARWAELAKEAHDYVKRLR